MLAKDLKGRLERLKTQRAKLAGKIKDEMNTDRRNRLKARLKEVEGSILQIEKTGVEVAPTGNSVGAQVVT